ncbi:MAG: MgtC/SapB family protein [Candidatus Omnitrophica bacterium]|nr:MgtC/SapB family protein [Candidatus Omnitrophota bacterium]
MLQEFIKIVLTIFLCSVIGAEREVRSKVAGLRTHILVGVGSCLIVLTSLYLFDIYKGVVVIDPTRMIANIITGIGFLCAGTIIRSGPSVIGLTTAATLWIVSCIGISVGAGHYTAAVMVTLVVFIVLVGMRSIDSRLHQNAKEEQN